MNVHSAVAASGEPPVRPILGIDVVCLGRADAIAFLQRRIADRRFTRVGFLNAHNANVACADPRFAAIMEDFVVLADGVGVDVAALLLHGSSFPANLNGTDLIPGLLRETARPMTVAMIGATQGNAEAAAATLRALAPHHRVVLVSHGFFAAADEPRILASLKELRPDVLLVALGVPKQEFWIHRHVTADHATASFAVGALFDFLSGAVPRAPEWMRRYRLEWLFRLVLEPRRLWQRYIVGNPLFLLRVLRQKFIGARR